VPRLKAEKKVLSLIEKACALHKILDGSTKWFWFSNISEILNIIGRSSKFKMFPGKKVAPNNNFIAGST
jgi:hypothetical protein